MFLMSSAYTIAYSSHNNYSTKQKYNVTKLKTLINKYEFFRKNGNVDMEIFYLKKQIPFRKQSGEFKELKKIFITLGDCYIRKNEFFKSLQSFFETFKYSKQTTPEGNGNVFNKIAKIFITINRKELAKKYLKKALDFAIRYDKDDLKISVFNDYGDMFFYEKEYNRAIHYNNLSLRLIKKKYFPELKLNAKFLKSRIYFKTDNVDEGLRVLKSAVDSAVNSKKYKNLLPVISEFIKRSVQKGNLKIASKYLIKLDDIYAPFYSGYFIYYYLNGILKEKRGDYTGALSYFKKTLNSLERFFMELNGLKDHRFRDEITNIYSEITRFYFKMFDRTNNVKFLKKAVFSGEMKNSYLFMQIPRKTKKITGNIKSELKKIRTELNIVRMKIPVTVSGEGVNSFYRNKIDYLNAQLMELNDLLIETGKKYRKYKISDLNIRKIQRDIDRATVIIKFIVLEDNSYAFIIDKKHLGYKKLDFGSKYIKNVTNSLLKSINDFSKGKVDFLRVKYNVNTSLKLYNVLLYEILQFQKDKKKLIIIPDNELFKIPFEALVIGKKKNIVSDHSIFSEYKSVDFLINDYSVEYYLSLFHFQKRKQYKKRSFKISAFGFPDLGKSKNLLSNILDVSVSELNTIPSANREIKEIKNIWGNRNGKFFTGDNFTKKNFNKYAGKSEIIHIATHFISNEKYPWYSFLLFSPGEENDPLYYVSDISKLQLKCDLIFLSTCQSSENYLLGSQTIHGLTASLFYSGAKSTIASLWPVNEFSSQIIPPFYSEFNKYKDGDENLSEILRKVKISFIKKKVLLKNGRFLSFSHPLIWANFNLYKFCF